jgi:hypothetical protein
VAKGAKSKKAKPVVIPRPIRAATIVDDVIVTVEGKVGPTVEKAFPDHANRLVTYHNPTKPERMGDVAIGGAPFALAAYGRAVYVYWNEKRNEQLTSGIGVLDLADAKAPRLVGWLEVGFPIFADDRFKKAQLHAGGGLLVFAIPNEPTAQVRVFDLADPLAPRPIGDLQATYLQQVFADDHGILVTTSQQATAYDRVLGTTGVIDVKCPNAAIRHAGAVWTVAPNDDDMGMLAKHEAGAVVATSKVGTLSPNRLYPWAGGIATTLGNQEFVLFDGDGAEQQRYELDPKRHWTSIAFSGSYALLARMTGKDAADYRLELVSLV